jgi:hypothetical protein
VLDNVKKADHPATTARAQPGQERRMDGATPWQRLKGPGAYPVEYAAWLLNPLRYLIMPPGRIVGRLRLSSTKRRASCARADVFHRPRRPAIRNRVTGMELDDYAKRAGLAKGESWSGWLVKTFNYRKPA